MDKKTNIKFTIIAVICIIILSIAVSPISLQNDTFYTIKIGEHIMQNGIDMKDHFSWHEDLPYTYPHWAYDVGIYLIYSVGGQASIYVSTIALCSLLGIILFLASQKITKNSVISLIVAMGVIYLLRDFIAARAQLVTFCLFALTIYFIEMFLETKKRRYAVGLVIIPIIIANVHLAVWPFYFILFLPYIGEYIMYHIGNMDIYIRKFKIWTIKRKMNATASEEEKISLNEKISKIEEKSSKAQIKKDKIRSNPYKLIVKRNENVKWLILIAIICVVTGLLTPLGTTPYTYLYNTIQGTTTQNINEHLPLTLIQNKEFACVIIVFLAILLFTDTKIRLKDLFMISGLMYLAFNSRRQVSMFVLIGSYILINLVNSLFTKYDPDGCNKIKRLSTKILGCVVLVLLVLTIGLVQIRPKIGDDFVSNNSYPVEASDYILENLDINTMKLFNGYNYGSYLLFRGIPVFIDSRADLYAPEFNGKKDIFRDYMNIFGLAVDYEPKFDEYGITHVMVYKSEKLNSLIAKDSKYKNIYDDGKFCIYERNIEK